MNVGSRIALGVLESFAGRAVAALFQSAIKIFYSQRLCGVGRSILFIICISFELSLTAFRFAHAATNHVLEQLEQEYPFFESAKKYDPKLYQEISDKFDQVEKSGADEVTATNELITFLISKFNEKVYYLSDDVLFEQQLLIYDKGKYWSSIDHKLCILAFGGQNTGLTARDIELSNKAPKEYSDRQWRWYDKAIRSLSPVSLPIMPEDQMKALTQELLGKMVLPEGMSAKAFREFLFEGKPNPEGQCAVYLAFQSELIKLPSTKLGPYLRASYLYP